MSMTPEDWQNVRDRLNRFGRRVELQQCDQYQVVLQRVRVKEMRDAICILVRIGDEFTWDIKWLKTKCDETSRFGYPHRRSYYTPSQKRRLLKVAIKSSLKRHHGIDLDKIVTLYDYLWPSVTGLIRHLKKHNSDITLLDEVQA